MDLLTVGATAWQSVMLRRRVHAGEGAVMLEVMLDSILYKRDGKVLHLLTVKIH